MEFRQIKYFIEVAKREHVTEAALALDVAQSAVSRQIFNLEEELGVDLFTRQGRNIELTSIGEEFLKQMEQAMNIINDAKQVVQEYTDPEKGTIHISFPSSIATYILPTAISVFREDYPNVTFMFKQGSYHELLSSMIKGDTNLAVLAPAPVKEKKIKSTILFTEKMVALLPINHPLAKSSSLNLNQLRDDSFILHPDGYLLRDQIMKECQQIGFKPIVSFEGENIDAIKGLVSADLGVSLVPEVTLVDNVPRAAVTIPLSEPNMTRTVGVVIPADRQLLPTEKLFFDFLKEFFTRLEKFQN